MFKSVAAATIAATVAVVTPAVAGTPDLPHRTVWMRTACASEDFSNQCYNHDAKGRVFYVHEFPGKAHTVCVMYVPTRAAKRLDHCDSAR